MGNHGFYQLSLPLERNVFVELSNSVDFEEVGKGRKGNHLVDTTQGAVPLVRTSTQYNKPAHRFSAIHDMIVDQIQSEASKYHALQSAALHFNNALIEIYDLQYTKMGYHSDQALDLEALTYVALFSCYEHADDQYALRKLKVKSKTTAEEFEFILEDHSVILFSLETNTKFQHKIVWEPTKGLKPKYDDNRWLGITFRQSKTFIHFKDKLPYFLNGEPLTLADEQQSKEFYQLRGQENNSIDFRYPALGYTLSIADTLEPKGT